MMDLKETIKRIKQLTSSVLVSNPSIPDTSSELISKIGAINNGTSNNKRPKQ